MKSPTPITAAAALLLTFALAAFAPVRAEGGQAADWMKDVDGHRPLSRLSIPGTHDAGAMHEPVPGTTRCQSLDLAQQLEAGVRFLDIRCRHVKDAFAIYHGVVDQKLSFDQVLQTLEAFLKAHPSECVILSIKEESTPEGNSRSFEDTFQSYIAKRPELWRLSADLPELGAARGKLVLFRRFKSAATGGIDASAWPDNASFSSGVLKVQDAYQVKSNDDKWQGAEQLLTEAESGAPQTLFVNFTSGYMSKLGIPSIPAVSGELNRRLLDYLGAHPQGCTGILVMDFVTPEQSAAVWKRNK